jgi:hypothetical protein
MPTTIIGIKVRLTHPQRAHDWLIINGGPKVQCYNMITNKRSDDSIIPATELHSTCVAIDSSTHFVYLFNYENDTLKHRHTIERYDPLRRIWTTLTAHLPCNNTCCLCSVCIPLAMFYVIIILGRDPTVLYFPINNTVVTIPYGLWSFPVINPFASLHLVHASDTSSAEAAAPSSLSPTTALLVGVTSFSIVIWAVDISSHIITIGDIIRRYGQQRFPPPQPQSHRDASSSSSSSFALSLPASLHSIMPWYQLQRMIHLYHNHN